MSQLVESMEWGAPVISESRHPVFEAQASLMGRLLRPVIAWKLRGKPSLPPPPLGRFEFPFGTIVATLDGTP